MTLDGDEDHSSHHEPRYLDRHALKSLLALCYQRIAGMKMGNSKTQVPKSAQSIVQGMAVLSAGIEVMGGPNMSTQELDSALFEKYKAHAKIMVDEVNEKYGKHFIHWKLTMDTFLHADNKV